MLEFKSKKGDWSDILILVIMLFIICVGFFVLAYGIPEIANGLSDAGLNNTPEGKGGIDELYDFGTNGIQQGVLFLFVGLQISILVSSLFTRTHPVFLFIYIFLLGLSIFLATFLANAYSLMVSSPLLAETLASQGILTWIMSHLVMIALATGALSIIITFVNFGSLFASGSEGGQM